jgi:hypothetical protein
MKIIDLAENAKFLTQREGIARSADGFVLAVLRYGGSMACSQLSGKYQTDPV